MDDLLPTFVFRYQLPTFPLPLFVSNLEDPEPLPTFVSKYQLPLFVSELEKPIIFTDDSTITSEDTHQSTVVPTYRKGNYNKLDDRLFDLDSITNTIPRNIVIPKNGSPKKKKLTATPNKTKETNTGSEEFQENEITNHLTDLMAQVDAGLQAGLAKIRSDDFDY